MAAHTLSLQRKKEIKQCQRKLQEVSKMGENQFCVDCGQKNPKWVSVNLGCWVCMRCSGYHRNLGVHISFVKSTTLDDWNHELLDNFLRLGGNAATKEIYGDVQIQAKWNQYQILAFFHDKYGKKLFANQSASNCNEKKNRLTRKDSRKRPKKKSQPQSIPDLLILSEVKEEEPPSRNDFIPDLLSFEDLDDFQFMSDLPRNDGQESSQILQAIHVQPARNVSKSDILCKYNQNWVRFDSEHPEVDSMSVPAMSMDGANENEYNYCSYNNMQHTSHLVDRVNECRDIDSDLMLPQSAKDIILSKYDKAAAAFDNPFVNGNVEKKNEMGRRFDPLQHINALCNNNAYYVYNGNMSC